MRILKYIVIAVASVAWLLFVIIVALEKLPDWLPAWMGMDKNMLSSDGLRGLGFYVAGVGIAPIGLYIAIIRANTLESQSENDRKRRLGEEFAKSVELLGNKTPAAR